MTDYQNLFESENSEEFELSSEECDVQQIMDCFAKYNETDVYPSAYCDNINLDNQIVPNLEDLSHENLPTKSPNEERLANGKQGFLSNRQDSKEETKENVKELNLSSKASKTKCKSRDYSVAKIQEKADFKSKNCRWSKQEDIKLFKVLNSVCQRLNIDMSRIKLSKGKVNKLHRDLFKSIKMEAGWRGTLVELKDRIIKIRSADKFTTREMRVLKRYLAKLANGIVSMEQVLEQLPGKSVEQILKFQKIKRF